MAHYVKYVEILFHLLCIAGFLFQVFLISINYFQFKTISSVGIRIPGVEKANAINTCFFNDEIFDSDNYLGVVKRMIEENRTNIQIKEANDSVMKKLIFRNMTINDRFHASILDGYYPSIYSTIPEKSIRYIFDTFICDHGVMYDSSKNDVIKIIDYIHQEDTQWNQLYISFDGSIVKNEIPDYNRENVTKMLIAMTPYEKLAYSEFESIGFIDINQTLEYFINISSHSYKFERLKSPYVDGCIDYTILGHRDRYDAVTDCTNKKIVQKYSMTSRQKIFTYSDSLEQVINYTMKYVRNENDFMVFAECQKIFFQNDCNDENTFSELKNISTKESDGEIGWMDRKIKIFSKFSKNPSYIAESLPKMYHIEYVTYILATSSIWFGFNFFIINPSKIIKKYFPSDEVSNEIQIESISHQVLDNEIKVRQLKNKNIELETRLKKIETVIKRIK